MASREISKWRCWSVLAGVAEVAAAIAAWVGEVGSTDILPNDWLPPAHRPHPARRPREREG
eukprot:790860-Pyramimonas_sp.AAC.1